MRLSFLPAVALVLAGCALPPEEEVVFPRSETVKINTISGPVGLPGNFNLWAGWRNRDQGIQNLLFESPWAVVDRAGVIHNTLAVGPPEYNEDFTQLTIRLREGVYWSDGVAFTTDDVVFTVETVKALPGLIFHIEMQAVENIYAADRYTVVFKLHEPDALFHRHFMDTWGTLFFMPKHIFEPVAAEGVEAFMAFPFYPPIGKGPFVLHSYDEAGFWTAWERREDWERTPTGMLFGKPAPRYVVSKTFLDEAGMIMAMRRHELDAAFLTIEPVRAIHRAMPDYAFTFRPDWPWIEGNSAAMSGVTFNSMKPPFDNPEVRWALTLALDIVSVSTIAFDGISELTPMPVTTNALFDEVYHLPMAEWLKAFTLDLGDGETFKPFDPDMSCRLAEFVRGRGFPAPDDPKAIAEFFGHGWWKHAPDIAARLLENNGFIRNAAGNWLLPDGSLWQFEVLTPPTPASDQFRFAHAVTHEWRRFGIEVTVLPSPVPGDLMDLGDFSVHSNRAAPPPWGPHPSLMMVARGFDSALVRPLGERDFTHQGSRWSDPRVDEILRKMEGTNWGDHKRHIELGRKFLKIFVEEKPAIVLSALPDSAIQSTYWWEGWPCIENPFNSTHHHASLFKFTLPFLRPTGR